MPNVAGLLPNCILNFDVANFCWVMKNQKPTVSVIAQNNHQIENTPISQTSFRGSTSGHLGSKLPSSPWKFVVQFIFGLNFQATYCFTLLIYVTYCLINCLVHLTTVAFHKM